LLLFYQPKEDVRRLAWYGMRQMVTVSERPPTAEQDGSSWSWAYRKLCKACAAALRARAEADAELDRIILNVLGFAARRSTFNSSQEAVQYYETLTLLKDAPSDPLQQALVAPFQKQSHEAYVGLAAILARPLSVDMLRLIRSSVDVEALCGALDSLQDSRERSLRPKLWLLGNIIFLAGPSNHIAYIATMARLLGSLADDVSFEGTPIDMENAEFDQLVLTKLSTWFPLNTFLDEQLKSLVHQRSIRDLLVRDSDTSKGGHAQVLAGYALTLLRCFPGRADDIRMWLYRGPTKANPNDVPATIYFWEACKGSLTFSMICRDSRNVLHILKAAGTTSSKEEWTVILIFLELYTFLLKIMNDEEFMGNASTGRNSAVPVGDVAALVTFLKNLGFTLLFHVSELNRSDASFSNGSSITPLSRHFGTGVVYEPPEATAESKPLTIAGLPGITIDYLKDLVTGLLRAIYERDSRRHFLPNGHWLMTDHFDMTAFIPSVVAEEESRHVVQEQDEEDRDLEDEALDDLNDADFGARGTTIGHIRAFRSQEARARAQRKASRRRYLETVAPRLEILQNMPFFIHFTTRVEIFRQFVLLDQQKRRNGTVDPDLWRHNMMFQPPGLNGMHPRDLLARHHAKVRRKNEFQDAFKQFYDLGAELKEPIQITFVDEFDIPEAGIDGGGVTKEFLTSVIAQAFDPSNESIGVSMNMHRAACEPREVLM